MRRWLLTAACLWGVGALAQLTDLAGCTDDFEECKESCSMRFGISTRVESRQKLGECFSRCQAKENSCRDRFIETRTHHLEDDALSKSSKPAPEPVPPRDDDRAPTQARPEASTDQPGRQNEPEVQRRTADLEPARPVEKPQPAAEAPARKAEHAGAGADRSASSPAPSKQKSKPPTQSQQPPAKKKRALDEWDPEAL